MLIGAYRDNEVNSAHPLMRKLEAIRQAGARVQEIILAPLAREDLDRLIADVSSLRTGAGHPAGADWSTRRPAGNPFFAIQFISALAEEALLTFDHGDGRWSWDLNRIHAKGYTDNVVDLMVGKVEPPARRNPEGTTRVCLPGKQRRDRHAFHRSRDIGGGGPLGSVGGGASGVHCAFGGLL